MSFLNPSYDELPDRVRRVLDGQPSDGHCCSQCRAKGDTAERMLRCSRCQVAYYCSRQCQQGHFDFHKSPCKRIAKQRRDIEEAQALIEGRELNEENNEMQFAMVARKMMTLADDLVSIGYRESDTISNGSVYYRRALSYYLEVLRLIQGSFFVPDSPLEDKVLLLLVVLGGDYKMMKEWCFKTGSPRFVNLMPPTKEAPPQFKTQGLAGDDVLFQALGFLTAMRLLAEYRRNLNAYETYKQRMEHWLVNDPENAGRFRPLCGKNVSSLISSYLLGPEIDGKVEIDVLPEEIRLLIGAIQYHGHGSYLLHLRDDIPLMPEHAPDLMRSGTSPEFWYLFQDCFFLTPGVYDVLSEYVPEENAGDEDPR